MDEKIITLLIADDEPIISDRMLGIFSEYPQLEVFNTYNGFRAAEIIKYKKVDIALFDICMPQMDGIRLMKILRESWPDSKVIFLTGHKSFDYAYESIQHNNVKYILKSEGEPAIKQAVNQFIRQIESEESQQALLKQAEQQLEQIAPMLWQNALSRVLCGDSLSILDNIYPPNEHLATRQPFYLSICRILSGSSPADSYLMAHKLLGLLKSIIPYDHISFIGPERNQLCILIFDKDKTLTIMHQMKYYFEQIQDVFFNRYESRISFIMSESPIKLEEIKDCYLELCRTANFHYGMELLFAKERDSSKNTDISELINLMNNIKQALYSGARNEFEALCADLGKMLSGASGRQEIFAVWHQSRAIFLEVFFRYEIDPSILYDSDMESLLKEAGSFDSEKLLESIIDFGNILFDKQEQSLASNSQNVVAQTNRYIDANLDSDLSLSTLANKVYLNRSYFSRLYKQISGINLSDYINAKRMEKAKQLLRSTTDKISDIASQIGFDSPSYFTVYFKKFQGISPADYRNNPQAH